MNPTPLMVRSGLLLVPSLLGTAILSAAPAPSGLGAYGMTSQARIVWQPVAAATGYNLYRSPSPVRPATPTRLSLPCNQTSWPGLGDLCTFDDAPLSNGTPLYYWLTALDATGEGPAAGPALAVPRTPPSVLPAPRVDRNRVVPGPGRSIDALDGGLFVFDQELLQAVVPHGALTLAFRHTGPVVAAAPSVQSQIDGASVSDIAVSEIASRIRGNVMAASQFRWSIFRHAPLEDCRSFLYVQNRSPDPVTVTPGLRPYGLDPVALDTRTLAPGRHGVWKMDWGAAPANQLKRQCFLGSFFLEHDGASPSDLVASLYSLDDYDPGRRYDMPLAPVGEAASGLVHTAALRIDAASRTHLTLRNNAASALEVKTWIYLDGAPMESLSPTLWVWWQPSPDPEVTGYRVYRRPACRDESCLAWQRLTDVPVSGPLYADAGLAFDQAYSYTVTATRSYFDESAVAIPADQDLPGAWSGLDRQYLPRFAYDGASDTAIRMRNTIDAAIAVELWFVSPDGVDIGSCAIAIPPNRATEASARRCLTARAGPAAEGSVRVEASGPPGALLLDGRWEARGGPKLDLTASRRWRGSHPGRNDAPYFNIQNQVRLDSTLYLQNLDDVETEVVPEYAGLDLRSFRDFQCTGKPIVLAPRGSAVVSVAANGAPCLAPAGGSYWGGVTLRTRWTAATIPADAESHVAGLVAVDDRAELSLVPTVRREITIYESADASAVVAPANAVGTAAASPTSWSPGAASLLYYELDDGVGLPRVIRVTKAASGLSFTF